MNSITIAQQQTPSREAVAAAIRRRLAEGFVLVSTGIRWHKTGGQLEMSCSEEEIELVLAQKPTCSVQAEGTTVHLVIDIAPPK